MTTIRECEVVEAILTLKTLIRCHTSQQSHPFVNNVDEETLSDALAVLTKIKDQM